MFTDVPKEHTAFIFRVKEGAEQVARKKRAASRVNFCWITCHYILEVINLKFQSLANILNSSDADDVALSETSSCGIPNLHIYLINY
jgi:hypothetical protein